MIELERCKPPQECKSDAEIDAWLQDKYLVINSNQKRFDPLEIQWENRIVDESILTWLPLSPKAAMTYEYEVKQYTLVHDSRI